MQEQPKKAGLPTWEVGHQIPMTASLYNFADSWARGGDVARGLQVTSAFRPRITKKLGPKDGANRPDQTGDPVGSSLIKKNGWQIGIFERPVSGDDYGSLASPGRLREAYERWLLSTDVCYLGSCCSVGYCMYTPNRNDSMWTGIQIQ